MARLASAGSFRPSRRTVAPALLVAMLVASIAPATAGAAQAPTDPEARVLSLINEGRAGIGRVALRWDGRLADVAQGRSDEMARTGTFGHIGWPILSARIEAEGIVWYYLGEALVKGTPRTPMESAQEAMTTWRNSQAHWDMLSNVDYNYVALGVAVAQDGWYYWTALLLKGPDRTRPTVSVPDTRMGSVGGGGGRSVTVSWSGADVPLSVLTAGLRDFRVQRRVGSGAWVRIGDWTAGTSRTYSLTVGNTYQFRVRARDHNGNKSPWSAAVTVRP
jgi:uncharacterized protein YkwD